MKRIIHVDEEVVSLYNITNDSFVGIHWESGSKCMVVATAEGYCSISDEYRPSTMSVWHAETIQEYVRRSLNQGNNKNSKAFVFDNVKALYEWMSK